MNKIYHQLVYLSACGVNQKSPSTEFIKNVDIENLYKLSSSLSIDALVGSVLKKSNVEIPKIWEENIQKSVRKTILFDAERQKICNYFEENKIWYVPLKGVILKDFYPSLGFRQMSDNDIWFDKSYENQVHDFMLSLGYSCKNKGKCHHNSYEKLPVYSFELHTTLFDEYDNEKIYRYYENARKTLIKSENSQSCYNFSDEDFYVYILSHAYKHYKKGGTGLRSLLDYYVFLKNKPDLDFSYVESACKQLGIYDYEQTSRRLCKKVFDENIPDNAEDFEKLLSAEEMEILCYYITSMTYGTIERHYENKFNELVKSTKCAKTKYVLSRIFPNLDFYKVHYPFFYRHKILLPFAWVYRLVKGLTVNVKKNIRELKYIRKIKK